MITFLITAPRRRAGVNTTQNWALIPLFPRPPCRPSLLIIAIATVGWDPWVPGREDRWCGGGGCGGRGRGGDPTTIKKAQGAGSPPLLCFCRLFISLSGDARTPRRALPAQLSVPPWGPESLLYLHWGRQYPVVVFLWLLLLLLLLLSLSYPSSPHPTQCPPSGPDHSVEREVGKPQVNFIHSRLFLHLI